MNAVRRKEKSKVGTGDPYPPCFYEPVSCPKPCMRPEYSRCPVNPEVRAKLTAPTSEQADLEATLPEEMKSLREEMRMREIMNNPHAREITEELRRLHSAGGGLVCPSCGDTDHGNRMNNKPWCMKCNLPLMSLEKAANWVKPKPPRRFSYGPDVDGVCRPR